jgi:uncharacterized RDD family membrane protein YckC
MRPNEDLAQPMNQTVQVIGFGRRLVAYLIDWIALSIVQSVLQFCVIAFRSISELGEDMTTGLGLLISCLSLLITAGYFVGFWATTGQTPGKMVMGIKVISTDGQSVSWGKAILRYFGFIISGLVLSLGFVWAAFDAKRQGWHDKIAGTYVVRKEDHFSGAEAVAFVPSDSGSSTILAVLLAIVPLLFLVAVVVIVVLALLGPAIGNVFSNIIENLATPTP